jgi:serine/threonine protein kinase
MTINAPSSSTGDFDLIEAARIQAHHGLGRGMRSPTGSNIPGYQLLREIHRGGQGVVYLAVQEATRRKVAIKIMRQGPFAGEHDRVRFEREVQVLAQLHDPHIVTVHDSGSCDGCFYFVMDYVAGLALEQHVDLNELSVLEILDLCATVCEAVNSAHLLGVIHRDIKPGNIRVDTQGLPRVLDFGLAKLSGANDFEQSVVTQMTATGQFIGSLPWASPEQARGEASKLDVRTDVYSLGVVIYQLLTGVFPYDVESPIKDVLERIATAEPAPPSTRNRSVDSEVDAIVLKAMSKSCEHRYQNAGELGRDIRRHLAGEPVEARRDSALYVVRKTMERYWVQSLVVSGVLLLILAFTVTITVMFNVQSKLLDQASADRRQFAGERVRLQEQVRLLETELEAIGAPQAVATESQIIPE